MNLNLSNVASANDQNAGIAVRDATSVSRNAVDVQVLPHDSSWASDYEKTAPLVCNALGANAIGIHHIGSTAILSIYAKPIIDILVEVTSIELVDTREPEMLQLGFESMGEFGIPARRYFRRNDAFGRRTHHVHVFQVGSDQIDRHLNFRDFMIAHPYWARQYSDLKRHLAEMHPNSMDAYVAGKDVFIRRVDEFAAKWRCK